MGIENNFEQFNYYVGSLFALLHDEFPCRKELNTVELIGAKECADTYKNGTWTGLYEFQGKTQNLSVELKFVDETVNWLYETGYLIGSINTLGSERRAIVTLSPKALEILKVIPLSSSKSFGQELSEAVKSEAKSKVSELASKALSYLFKFGWDFLTNPIH